MYELKKVRFPLALLVLLALFATGCFGGGGGASFYTVTGTVTEAGTGVPLSGAKVEMNTKSTTTNAEGKYSLTSVPKGTSTLKVTLDGYKPKEQSINLTKNQTANVSLDTDAPALDMDVLSAIVVDGSSIEDTTITLEFNIDDLLPPTGVAGLNALNAAVEVEAYAIVNGAVYILNIDYSGRVNQKVPVNPGKNIIQLRIRTSSGYSRTSPIITINVSIPRLDIRTVLEWDTDYNDVDIHMFKRLESEDNIFVWDDAKHVYYGNHEPFDFGTGNENPFLDVDDMYGYGPETIVLKEATPGDYHIWVHPYDLEGVPATATVTVILNGGQPGVKQEIFEIELPLQSVSFGRRVIPEYVTTVRVSAPGVMNFVQVEPTPMEIDASGLGVQIAK